MSGGAGRSRQVCEMRRRMISVVARSLLVLVLLPPGACQANMHSEPADPHRDILLALRERGEAPVMIALHSPTDHADSATAERTRATIARMQEEVIAAVDSADFRLRVRFGSVPALSGVVRTERGLRRLLSHPHVRAVSLDSGGTGTG
jgi:hypothetical protein